MAHIFLHAGELNDAFIDRALRNEAVNGDLTGLTQTMCTVHGLGVVRRVPIMIVKDHSVSCSEVDTKATSTCAKKEDEDVGPRTMLVMRQTLFIHVAYRVCHSMTISRRSSNLEEPSRRRYLYWR